MKWLPRAILLMRLCAGSLVEASRCMLNRQNGVNLSTLKYNVSSKRAANFKTNARRTCFALISYIWSLSATPKRSCACEINLNLTDLHGNGYWLADTATQLYADENISHLLLALLSLGEDKSHRDENVISEANTLRRNTRTLRACRPPAGCGFAKVSVSKPDMLSNCFIRGRGNVIPAVHTPESLCARYEASWMKNNVHTRSGTQLDSTSESRYVVPLTSSINIIKICSSKAASAATELTAEGCCCQKTWRRTLSRWLRIMQIWLTGFHCPVITTLCIYTVKPLENLIKSAQIGNESSWYAPPFTSSHYSVCVCTF